jgi:subtilisin family serine protease
VNKYFLLLFVLTIVTVWAGERRAIQAQQPEQRAAAAAPRILLKAATFDPLAGEPSYPTALQAAPAQDAPVAYLVQFQSAVQHEWKDMVTQEGAQLYGYIPDYTFLAWMDAQTAARVQQLAPVRWVGRYQPAYRLAPALLKKALASIGSSANTTPMQPDSIYREPLTLVLKTLPASDLTALTRQIEALDGVVQDTTINPAAGYILVHIFSDRLVELAQLEGVIWIEQQQAMNPTNDVAAGDILHANEVRADLGLYGKGQVIGIADTGLDVGKKTSLHPDLKARLLKAFCLGRSSPCDWSDFSGHGTHIAGSVLGDGRTSGSIPADHAYAQSYAGMAPEAKFIFQSLMDDTGVLSGIPTDRGDLMRQAYDEGVRIHTNAWGGPTGEAEGDDRYGGYVLSSAMVDFAAWQYKDMLLLFTAGNGGRDGEKDGQGRPVGNGIVDADAIEQPGTAKNVLTVGASENERSNLSATWGGLWPQEFPAEPIASDRLSSQRNGMAGFSSRGPTDDGRIKPELVAPGTSIVSLQSYQSLFTDDLEAEDTAGRYMTDDVYGGTGSWELLDGEGRHGSQAWQLMVTSAWSPAAATILYTPPINIQRAGAAHLSFWHACQLAPDNEPAITLRGTSYWNPYEIVSTEQIPLSTFTDQSACSGDFSFVSLTSLLNEDIAYQYGIDPTRDIRFGFSIVGTNGVYHPGGIWKIDDLRVHGYTEQMLSDAGMAEAGSEQDAAYMLLSGTSMATALTAGGAALVREWLVEQAAHKKPSSALMRALLLNTATHPAPGQYGSGEQQEIPTLRPNSVSGWGRLDLHAALNPSSSRQLWLQDDWHGVGTGEQARYKLIVDHDDLQEPSAVSITLAWTDYPGEPGASRALVNDLDLAVIAPDHTLYHGNEGVYAEGDACFVEKYDACNTSESVFIPDAPAGTYRVFVTGIEVPVGDDQSGAQPFALVATGPNLRSQSKLSLPLVQVGGNR